MDLEDGALVPATGSVVPTGSASAAMPAGPNPTPMTVDDGIFHQPVQRRIVSLRRTISLTSMRETLACLDRKLRKGTARSWSKWFSNCVRITKAEASKYSLCLSCWDVTTQCGGFWYQHMPPILMFSSGERYLNIRCASTHSFAATDHAQIFEGVQLESSGVPSGNLAYRKSAFLAIGKSQQFDVNCM